MDWRNANWLIWLLPLAGAWVGFSIYSAYRNQSARHRFMAAVMSETLMPKKSLANQIAKAMLQTLGVSLVLIALAGPQFGEQIETIVPKGSDLYVLLDVSRSMLANDVPPSRIERAKADIGALVNSLTGERVGLIAFAGQAVVKVPLTVDYDSFRRTLAGIDTASAPRGGTAIGDAIRKALEVFQPNSQRDQSILLITDGDDQKSAPLEAAEVAAERSVTIFSIGLGDSTQGARIPAKDRTGQFVEFEGEQVWSKLESSLLEQLASKTGGVYIPAGTKSYDLREIYRNYLAERDGKPDEKQTRIRRGEQFQWFLGLGISMLLIDLLIKPFKSLPQVGVDPQQYNRGPVTTILVACFTLSLTGLSASPGLAAEDSKATIQQGLKHYEKEDFEKASEIFEKAAESLREAKSQEQHLAIFDQACAEHRLGNRNKAMDLYLQAAMARDRGLAAKANFNLARLHVDNAKEIWREGTQVIEDKEEREKLVDEATRGIAAYRASLELDSGATTAKKNIEIVRQWLKVVMDQWKDYDLKKRRQELDLLQYVDYIQGVQKDALTESETLKDLHQLDRHAELKLLQDTLIEEFPYLNQKIQEALDSEEREPQKKLSEDEKKETQKVIDLLLSWSDTSRDYMKTSSVKLGRFRASESLSQQRSALEELDRIWNAISPLEPTLQRSITEQRKVESDLKSAEQTPQEEQNAAEWIRAQEQVLARAITLAPKAQAMLSDWEASRASEQPTDLKSDVANPEANPADQQAEMQLFLNNSIEKAPLACDEILAAIDLLKKNNPLEAYEHAAKAREILEEIQKQKPNNQDQDQQQGDSNNPETKDQNPSQQDKSDGQDSPKDENEQQESDSKEKDNSDSDQSEADQKEKSDKTKDEQNKQSDKDQKTETNQNNTDQTGKENKAPSQDRIAEALRKVREREAEKRERDRQRRIKAYGQLSVEKDW